MSGQEGRTNVARSILSGVRVLELGGIGPGPHAAMLLGDLGADVVRIERPEPGVQLIDAEHDTVLRNRRSVFADLKTDEGRALVLDLADRADVLIEGFRPGTLERLGISPSVCLERNPRLVYSRITGWGQDGPMAHVAGHDINYLAISGGLAAFGRPGVPPFPPLNLVADLGGGSLYAVVGILGALLEVGRSGRGQVIDAAIVDGVSSLMAMYWNLVSVGAWSLDPGTNMTDGAAPFYNTYECSDGRYIAVGAVETKFYATLLTGLGLDPADSATQHDRSRWPGRISEFATIFGSASRDEWVARFDGLDACVSPVLSLDEVADHPHIRARKTIVNLDGVLQPVPAPRFSKSPPPPLRAPRRPGVDRDEVLADWSAHRLAQQSNWSS